MFNAVQILRDNGREFYVKQDLRQCAPSVKLTIADAHCVTAHGEWPETAIGNGDNLTLF